MKDIFSKKNKKIETQQSDIQPLVRKWMRDSVLCIFIRLHTTTIEFWIQGTVKDFKISFWLMFTWSCPNTVEVSFLPTLINVLQKIL